MASQQNTKMQNIIKCWLPVPLVPLSFNNYYHNIKQENRTIPTQTTQKEKQKQKSHDTHTSEHNKSGVHVNGRLRKNKQIIVRKTKQQKLKSIIIVQ